MLCDGGTWVLETLWGIICRCPSAVPHHSVLQLRHQIKHFCFTWIHQIPWVPMMGPEGSNPHYGRTVSNNEAYWGVWIDHRNRTRRTLSVSLCVRFRCETILYGRAHAIFVTRVWQNILPYNFAHRVINCSQKVRKLFSKQYIWYNLILSLYMVYIIAMITCCWT